MSFLKARLQTLLKRDSTPEEIRERVFKGRRWEDIAGLDAPERKIPWGRVNADELDKNAQNTISGFTFGNPGTVGGVTTTQPASHTHPASDIQAGSAQNGMVIQYGSGGWQIQFLRLH
jgi:hypothetical protein